LKHHIKTEGLIKQFKSIPSKYEIIPYAGSLLSNEFRERHLAMVGIVLRIIKKLDVE